MSVSNPNVLTYTVSCPWKIFKTRKIFYIIRFFFNVMWSDPLYHYSLLQIFYKYRYIIAYAHTHLDLYGLFYMLIYIFIFHIYIHINFHIYMHIDTYPNVFLTFCSSVCLEFSFMYFTCLIWWEISLFFISIPKEEPTLK